MTSISKISFILSFLLILIDATQYQVIKQRIQTPIPHTLQYFLSDLSGNIISPWSDINIQFDDGIITGIIQIPKQSSAKLEMIKQYPKHPLMQDTRTNKYNNKIQLRHYAIPLPLVNYGYVPMTWEQSITPDENGFFGDDDPIDIVDLTQTKDRKILDIARVKILGAFCLIDQGELDWKVFVIDVQQAEQRDIESYEDIKGEKIQQIMNWFKIYKTYDGKAENTIGFGGKIFSKDESLQIVFNTYVQFMKLRQGRTPEYEQKKKQFNL